jgi:hypothetical protein
LTALAFSLAIFPGCLGKSPLFGANLITLFMRVCLTGNPPIQKDNQYVSSFKMHVWGTIHF